MKVFKIRNLALIAILVFCIQIFSTSIAFADPGSADLRVDGYMGYSGRGGIVNVCNDGDETVESFELSRNLTGADFGEYIVGTDQNVTPATDPGTISQNGLWEGVVENGQCVSVVTFVTPTVALGQQYSFDFSVDNSVLLGGGSNVDPNSSNDSKAFGPFTNVALPDITNTPRLVTTGNIQNGTDIVYEVTIGVNGPGSQLSSEQMTIAFLVPTTANFSEVTDADLSDDLSINFCAQLGDPINAGAGLGAYDGNIIYCQLNVAQDLPPGTSYKFNFEMEATSEFTEGGFAVYSFVLGFDLDSLLFQAALTRGEDIFQSDINNRAILEYDNTELAATITRCPGQPAVTSVGTGCFRVTFNKLIWAPSFEQGDLVLDGGGSITGFSQLDDFTWEVTVSGITPNSTLSLSLVDGAIQDYNAVLNSVQVLGENTIRYEVVTQGTLPATGNRGSNFLAVVSLMLIGIGLLIKKYAKIRVLKG